MHQEFYVTVVCKVRVPLEAAQALEWIEQMEAFPCLPIDSVREVSALERNNAVNGT